MINLSTSAGHDIAQLLTACFIFIFVLVICYLTTKFVGNYSKQQYSNKNIQVVETIRIANNKFIQLLSVGEVYLVVGVCKDNITVLSQLSKEEFPDLILTDLVANKAGVTDALKEGFGSIFEKMKKK